MNKIYKKVLIVGSPKSDLDILKNLLTDLHNKGIGFIYWGTNQTLVDIFKANNWPYTQLKLVKLSKLTAPFAALTQLYYTVVLNGKIKKLAADGVTTSLLCCTESKFYFSKLSTKNNLKLNWLELPAEVTTPLPKIKALSKTATIITWSSTDKHQLEKNGISTTIKTIQPGILPKPAPTQDTIFQGLARIEHPRRKFFTIGTITDLDNHRLETIFKSVARALEVIPNIQLVVVGGGPQKKTLMWLAKKMGIESSVWLVGEQANPRKWLENLDLYLSINQLANLSDLFFTLEVMAAKLPIIGNFGSGLDDLVFEGKNGYLTCMNDSEVLAQCIINIEQDIKLREKLSQVAFERVVKHFNHEQMVAQFEKIL